MLLPALIVIGLSVLARFFIMRYTGDPVFATLLPAAVVAAFLLGHLASSLFFPGNAAA